MDLAMTVSKAARDTFNLARVYQTISWVHFEENKFPEALDAIEEAWKHAELTASRRLQKNISLDLLESSSRSIEILSLRHGSISKYHQEILHILGIATKLHGLWTTWAMARGTSAEVTIPKCIWCL